MLLPLNGKDPPSAERLLRGPWLLQGGFGAEAGSLHIVESSSAMTALSGGTSCSAKKLVVPECLRAWLQGLESKIVSHCEARCGLWRLGWMDGCVLEEAKLTKFGSAVKALRHTKPL